MPDGASQRTASRLAAIGRIGAMAALYYGGSLLGHVLLVPGTNVGLFWPSAGLAVGLMYLWGYQTWVGVALAAAAANLPGLLAEHSPGLAVGICSGEVLADVVQAVLPVWALRRALGSTEPLATARGAVALVAWGGVVGQAAGATVGVATLWAAGVAQGAAVPHVWLNWWLSNVASVAVLAPLCLAWRFPWKLERPHRYALGALAAVATGAAVFLWLDAAGHFYLDYLSVLAVLWAAFALGARGATMAAFLLSALALAATANGLGPFSSQPLDRQLFLISFLLITLSVTGLMVSAVLEERRRAEADREEVHRRLAESQRIESLGRLAGGVAHDLNNLLMPVMSYAELVLRSAPPGSQTAADLNELLDAAMRARDVTRQLLAFGRRQQLAFKTLDLRAALQGVEKLLARTLREDIRVEVQAPAQLGQVRGDQGQLEQVLMNLAVNAQHAMPRGGTLRIELSDLLVDAQHPVVPLGVPAGRWVVLAVSDTGVGMERAVLARIFEPFFTTKPVGEGTGLGLSIVHGIVRQHDGHITASSEPGQGTRLQIYLPRVEAASPVVQAAAPAAIAGGAETVLLAEDDEGVRAVTQRILEGLGYRVLVGPGALACLELAAAEQGVIHLLLSDVMMPHLSGPELYAKLRAGRPALKVLFMSGYAGEALASQQVPADAGFLQKPFTVDALGAALRQALERPATAPGSSSR